MVTRRNDVVGFVSIVVVPGLVSRDLCLNKPWDFIPVKGQVVAWSHLNGIRSWDIAHDIAAQVDGIQIFHWRVVVAAFARSTIIRGNANALEEALIFAIDENTLQSSASILQSQF